MCQNFWDGESLVNPTPQFLWSGSQFEVEAQSEHEAEVEAKLEVEGWKFNT